MEKVKYAVAANSNESLTLWKKWHEYVKWEDIPMGKIFKIGEINNLPVKVELFWNIVNGHKIVFYSACSRMVDHEMIENWLKENALETEPVMVVASDFCKIANYLP